MSHLFDASRQWAERPADQRFWSIDEMHNACSSYAASAAESKVQMNEMIVMPTEDDDLRLVGPSGQPAKLTHWSFGQLANRCSAPAGYLKTLPADLSSRLLTHHLHQQDDDRCNALFHANGSLVCRAFTSDDYARIWNKDVTSRLLALDQDGWRVPPARPAFDNQPGSRIATEDDVLKFGNKPGLAIKVGDRIAPAGLYASDHDMFAFFVNDECRIDDGTEEGLGRGFFVSNSEVGAAAFKITRFLYRYVCGNHIVWDAKDVQEIRLVHRGRNDSRFGSTLRWELRKYADESTAKDQERITLAKGHILGKNKDEVLDMLFKTRVLPRKTLEAAYDHALMESDVRRKTDPRSVWGMVQGVTAMSQNEQFADSRMDLDRAAGKIMSIAF